MANIFDLFKKISPPEPPGPPTHLLVGLGNPGDKYALTRHNAGFLALSHIARERGVRVDRLKFRALIGQSEIAGVRVLLMAPQTYMNLSGEAVRECAAFYKIPPKNILVLSDDVNLEVGRLRVRRGGSDGGQNGLKNIIYHLNSDAFPRIRIGVGSPPHPDYDMADWVLSEFTPGERKIVEGVFELLAGGVEKILGGDIEEAMRLCNGEIRSD